MSAYHEQRVFMARLGARYKRALLKSWDWLRRNV